MLYRYAESNKSHLINSDRVTSKSPVSSKRMSGITGSAKKDNVMKGSIRLLTFRACAYCSKRDIPVIASSTPTSDISPQQGNGNSSTTLPPDAMT